MVMNPDDGEAAQHRRLDDQVFYRISPVTNGVADFHHVDQKGAYVPPNAVDMLGNSALDLSREVARGYYSEQRGRILTYENKVTLYKAQYQMYLMWHISGEHLSNQVVLMSDTVEFLKGVLAIALNEALDFGDEGLLKDLPEIGAGR